MKTLPPSGSQLFDTAIFNAQVPKEGPKALGISVPFTTADTSFLVTQLLTQSQQFMSLIQAVFVDNSNNPAPISFTTAVLNQTLTVPPNSQAYLPLLVPARADITVESEGAVTIKCVFLNVPVPAAVWSVPGNVSGEFQSVAASAADLLGVNGGAKGDYLSGVLIVPANLNPGAVTLTDGASAVTIFTGGAASVTTLVPFFVPWQTPSLEGAWTLTTGADVSAVAFGTFT